MWKFIAILLSAALFVYADEEQSKKDQQTPSLIDTALCYVSPRPWDCVRQQAGRALNYWDVKIEGMGRVLMDEADKEMNESVASRGLSVGENTEKPSEVLKALEKGLSTVADIVTEGFDVSDSSSSRGVKEARDDDDTNDFNDISLYDALEKAHAEGRSLNQTDNQTDEARAKGLTRQNGIKNGYGFDDESGGFGYGGYRGKGKKHKKGKKGLMKIFFLGAIIKSKVELLLKILSFHLQLKFFSIALVGLVINLARFWLDLKRQPGKHHYEDHGDDWSSNWKRESAPQDRDFAQRLAYNNAYPQQH